MTNLLDSSILTFFLIFNFIGALKRTRFQSTTQNINNNNNLN